jgi:hypothetical protein
MPVLIPVLLPVPRRWRRMKRRVSSSSSRLVDELNAADWKRSPQTDADGQCEFTYQPDGFGRSRTGSSPCAPEKPKPRADEEQEQYQLPDTPEYSHRVFVTNMKGHDRIAGVVLQSASRSRESDQGSQ